MTRLQEARKYYKITLVLSCVFKLLMLFGFMYVIGIAGESDYEVLYGGESHSGLWYTLHSLLGLSMIIVGCRFALVFDGAYNRLGRYISRHSVGGITLDNR